MKFRDDFPRRVVEWPDVAIAMPDGTRLSARIWLPDDAADRPVPAILEHLPYRKRDGTIARDTLTHPYLAGHGYACIRTDMRGSGDSDGLLEDEYTHQEWNDALAVMEWARAQPWCTGDWGMMGISWGGFNALQVAALRPKGLKAIITLCSTVDRYADDIHWKGGCMLGENLGWAAQMLAYSSRPPDPAVVGSRWRDMWRERLESQPFLLETWLGHQRRDGYWRHGSVCEDWTAIEAAVLAVGGWHDGYRNTPGLLARHLDCPVKAIVGPWIHKYPHYAAPEPRIGFLQEALRWWDRWLKGKDTGVDSEPRERLYLMDSVRPERWLTHRPGRWIAVADDPQGREFALGDGTLGEKCDFARRILSPQTCGDGAGEYFPFAFGPELPADQTGDDAMSATFVLAPERAPMNIVGAPVATLRLVPEAPTGQIALRLCDLRPDGTSALIAHGFLNLQHRNAHAEPEPVIPGEPIEVVVALDRCAYRLPPRHGLRLAISTSYWPFIWPAPDHAAITLTGGRLTLPLLAEIAEAGPEFPKPEAAGPWQAEQLRPPVMTRETRDLPDGTRVTRIVTDNGEVRDKGHGLVTGSVSEEVWRIHPENPLSADAQIRWETVTSRGDWRVRTVCRASLAATRDNWLPKASIRAFEREELVLEREFTSMIPRDGM